MRHKSIVYHFIFMIIIIDRLLYKAKVTDMQEAVCVLDDINLAAAKEWVVSER